MMEEEKGKEERKKERNRERASVRQGGLGSEGVGAGGGGQCRVWVWVWVVRVAGGATTSPTLTSDPLNRPSHKWHDPIYPPTTLPPPLYTTHANSIYDPD